MLPVLVSNLMQQRRTNLTRVLDGMRVLLDRFEQNEKRMNLLCQRLSLLDPSFKNRQQNEQPL